MDFRTEFILGRNLYGDWNYDLDGTYTGQDVIYADCVGIHAGTEFIPRLNLYGD